MGETGVYVDSPNFTAIPIIDFAQTTQSDTRKQFLAQFRNALVNVGFLYLKNPPVPTNVQENLIQKAKAMFDLFPEKKEELDMVNSKHFLGYTRLGVEKTAQKTDYREAFDFSTEAPAPGPDEPLYRNLFGPNQWPRESDIPEGRDAIEADLSAINRLADDFKILIWRQLAWCDFLTTPPQLKIKLAKYLPPDPSQWKELDASLQGVGIHKDASFMTFLPQATPHAGLDVQNKSAYGSQYLPFLVHWSSTSADLWKLSLTESAPPPPTASTCDRRTI